MSCPCKHNQVHVAPAHVKENKTAPRPVRRIGVVRHLRREIK